MKKLITILLSLHASLFTVHQASAQGCLPEGITFETQAQIDSFQINYPGCSVIEGDVTIIHYYLGDTIYNLEGLSVIALIGGDLRIEGLSLLNGLNGLNNLVSISGDLTIESTDSLGSLQGLENLTSIGDSLIISNSYHLTSFSGLQNLDSIGGGLIIQWNADLTSLSGFENLASIGGGLTITDNYSLSDCEAQGICNYLASPAAAVNIYKNASGCNNPPEVASGCGISLDCLPYGNYYFFLQEEIDNFQFDYPDCTELAGNVTIGSDVANLSGLNPITGISGNLDFWGNNVLISLSGLDGLDYIGGSLTLYAISSISNLTGLGSLDSVGGNLIIACQNLSSLNGLNEISSVGGDLYMGYYNWLPGYFGNPALTTLAGMDGLTTIGGNLNILGNNSLNTLSGLQNIASIGGGISIIDNTNLTDCAIQSLCDYVSSPNGIVEIYENAQGCNNQSELANNCGGASYCLPYGNYYFFAQSDIDNFPLNFSGCTDLQGTVTISGPDISDLNGLSQVTSVSGDLQVGMYNYFSGNGNPLLKDLSGLESLNFIGGNLWINNNDSLKSLAGLENLTTIGLGLLIGYDYGGPDRYEMSSLADLTALDNLTSIGGILCVRGTAVTNLSGIDNIEAGSIGYLDIEQNNFLTECKVNSVCEYLSNPDAVVFIGGNAPGCDSEAEVEAACAVGIQSAVGGQQSAVTCYPNPTTGNVSFQWTMDNGQWTMLKIYNAQGQLVATLLDEALPAGEHTITWNAVNLPAGIYYYRLTTDDRRPTTGSGKIVKY